MSEHLKKHIRKFVDISEQEYAAILPYFTVMEVAKKKNLLTEGSTCKFNYFVSKGCLRMFFLL